MDRSREGEREIDRKKETKKKQEKERDVGVVTNHRPKGNPISARVRDTRKSEFFAASSPWDLTLFLGRRERERLSLSLSRWMKSRESDARHRRRRAYERRKAAGNESFLPRAAEVSRRATTSLVEIRNELFRTRSAIDATTISLDLL